MDMMKENPEIMRVSLIDLYLQIQGTAHSSFSYSFLHSIISFLVYIFSIQKIVLVFIYLLIYLFAGDVFVGTRSSNWCRLIDELRKTNGKARVPYYSPEDVYSYD